MHLLATALLRTVASEVYVLGHPLRFDLPAVPAVIFITGFYASFNGSN